jgi:hypothetical protein
VKMSILIIWVVVPCELVGPHRSTRRNKQHRDFSPYLSPIIPNFYVTQTEFDFLKNCSLYKYICI